MSSFTAKQNHLGKAVSKILRYRQTQRHRCCYFYTRITFYFRGEFEEANKILTLLNDKNVPHGKGVKYNFITGTARYANLIKENIGAYTKILEKYMKDYKPGQLSKFNS